MRAGSGEGGRLQGQHLRGHCDTVVALSCNLPVMWLKEHDQGGVPLVLADSKGDWDGGSDPSVTVTNDAGGYEATRHLLQRGRRKVAFIAETPGNPNFFRRERYLRAHADIAQEVILKRQSGTLGRHRGVGAAAGGKPAPSLELPAPLVVRSSS